MDITAIFKSYVDTIRQQNKELSFLSPPPDKKSTLGQGQSKPKIFPGKKSEYYARARDISTTITSLRDFLYESRSGYLNICGSANVPRSGSVFGGHARSKDIPIMTDIERDQIDNDVSKIVQNCQKRILEYEKLIESTETINNNPNLRTHMQSIADSLSMYLKNVTALFSEMRAIRVKRTIDYQTMSKLSASTSLNRSMKTERSEEFNGLKSTDKEKIGKRTSLDLNESEVDGHSTGSPHPAAIPDYFLEDDPIPPEELQMLEEENANLLNELNSIAQEVDQIQSNVVQIAQLQEIFTEKVLQQEKEIDLIANVVVGTTENIKGGNEQIRQAIQKNADFRAWVLFFILVMSFSLLFLDWYND